MQTPTISEIGSLVGVLVIVKWFLMFLKDERKARESLIAGINQQCHEFQVDISGRHQKMADKVATALDRNTEQLGHTAECLSKNAEVLAKLDSDFIREMKERDRQRRERAANDG